MAERERERERERRGITAFDGVLLVGGGLIALFVAFKLLGFVAGLVWLAVKLVVVIALVAFVFRMLFRRRA